MMNDIQGAIFAPLETKQGPKESEIKCSVQFNKAYNQFCNVYNVSERCTMFTEELDPAILAIVSQRHDGRMRTTYFELVQYSKAEGDALRARSRPRIKCRALPMENYQSNISMMPQNYTLREVDDLNLSEKNLLFILITELPYTLDASYHANNQMLYGDRLRLRAPAFLYANVNCYRILHGWTREW